MLKPECDGEGYEDEDMEGDCRGHAVWDGIDVITCTGARSQVA